MTTGNLFDSLQPGYTPGGTWSTGDCDGNNNNTINISDPTNVDFSGQAPGDYWFSYTASTNNCAETCVSVYYTVLQTPLVSPITDTVCQINGVIDDSTISTTVQQSNPSGAWSSGNYVWEITNGATIAGPTTTNNANISAVITGSNLSTGSNVFNLNVENATDANCNNTTTITITVLPNLSAGNDNSLILCDDGGSVNVDLSTMLTGNDVPSGATETYTDSSNNVVGMNVTLTAGTYTYTYTVSNGECEDSATLTIIIEEAPDAGVFAGPITICNA